MRRERLVFASKISGVVGRQPSVILSAVYKLSRGTFKAAMVYCSSHVVHRNGMEIENMDVINQEDTEPFTTADGSTIRELLAHRNSSIRQQSLAEARLAPGVATTPHHHAVTEEIYYILVGEAEMSLGDETRDVRPGDAIAIPPGQRHTIKNTGAEELVFLCTCAPGYEHTDTFLEN